VFRRNTRSIRSLAGYYRIGHLWRIIRVEEIGPCVIGVLVRSPARWIVEDVAYRALVLGLVAHDVFPVVALPDPAVECRPAGIVDTAI